MDLYENFHNQFCQELCRLQNCYKASKTKPAELLQTPIYCQLIENSAIDFFELLSEIKDRKNLIFRVDDCCTKWIELFATNITTAGECTVALLVVSMMYGLPQRTINENGCLFTKAVMQQMCYLLDVKHTVTPVYLTQVNMVQWINCDLKSPLAILVGNEPSSWVQKLPTIRYAMKIAKCSTTGQTAAFLHLVANLAPLMKFAMTSDLSQTMRPLCQR